MPTADKKNFILSNGLEAEQSIKLGGTTHTSLLDSSAVVSVASESSTAKSISKTGGLLCKNYDSADLLPTSGVDSGEFGFVTSTDRLYIWNGSGWYNIALVNTTPTLSTTPDSNYSMDSVGASLSITILAADPEEVPITYTATSDSSSSFVNITQDSGVFTITPLTQAQLDSNGVGTGGTFSITFKASDGVNIAPAVSNFTLTIAFPFGIYDWTQGSQQAKIKATSGAANEYYGWDVAIDKDANTAIASVPYGNTTVAGQGEVFIYTLGSAYDWNNNSISSSNQNYSQYGAMDEIGVFDFSSDGNHVFIYGRAGSNPDHVYRYPLSTAYDVTTTSNSNVQNIDVSGQSIDGTGSAAATDGYAMKIGKNGTRLYIVDHGDNVFQWDLSTANDLTSASYGTSFDVSTQATDPSGIEFNSDGTKMYVGDEQDRTIYEYNLSTAWEVNTATYSQSRSFATAGSGGDQASNTNLVTTQRGIAFNNDGTRIYIVCNANNVVYRFDLSTAYDITTAVYNKWNGSTLIGYVALGSNNYFDLKWNPDGSKMYVGVPSDDRIRQYGTPAQWSEQQILNLNSTSNSYFGWSADIASDGDTIVAGAVSDNAGSGGRLGVFNRDSAGGTWTLDSSLSASDAADGDFLGEGCAISGDGNTIIGGAARKGSGTTRGAAYIFTKGITKYDLGSYGLTQTSSALTEDASPQGILFNADGTKMYTAGDNNDTVYQYSLSTAYDLSTISYDNVSLDISGGSLYAETNNVWGIRWNDDGTKLFAICRDRDDIVAYDLTTPYDLSTGSYNNEVFDISGQDGSGAGFSFKPDGTKMYMVGYVNDKVFQYSLSTAYDVSTASYDSASFSVASQDTTPQDVVFNPDGNKMFILGDTNNAIYQYSLSTAWDITTASYDNTSKSIVESSPRQMVFGPNGDNFFTIGRGSDKVRKYSTGGWNQQAKITPATAAVGSGSADFGKAVTITNDGNAVAIGAPGNSIASGSIQGHVEVYTRSGSTWTHLQSITQSSPSSKDGFGWTVSLSGNDGYTLAIGQHYETTNDEGNCWIFTRDSAGGTFSEQKALRPSVTNTEDFGINVSLSDDGNSVLVGAQADDTGGTAFVYRRSSNQDSDWTEKKKLAASDAAGDDYFGYAVSLSGDGSSAIVGAWGEDTNGSQSGSAYIFKAPDSA